MKKILVITSLLILISIGCEDKKFFNFTTFDGYTSRDFEGFLVGTEDTTDWNLNDNWKKKEKDLFTDYDSYTYDCNDNGEIEIKALPNPTSEYIFISLKKDSLVKFDYRLMNENWDILYSEDNVTKNIINFKITDLVTDETLVRFYYRFKKPDNCAFIGHGDIRIN